MFVVVFADFGNICRVFSLAFVVVSAEVDHICRDFSLAFVSAPSCFRARCAALKQVVTPCIPTGVYTFSSRGPVAQWIERLPPEQKVVGSNPIRPTFDFLAYCACNFSRVGATTA